MVLLSSKIRAEIAAVVAAAAKSGELVRAYFEAEKIRQANIVDNMALEDIVEAIIELSVGGPGYESDPGDARGAMLGSPTLAAKLVH
jgi:hypothetical protein